MADAFLNDADLLHLTGYKRSADQAKWLEEEGIPFRRNRLGKVVVRRDYRETEVSEPELGPVP